MRIIIIGACQAAPLAMCLRLLVPGASIESLHVAPGDEWKARAAQAVRDSDVVVNSIPLGIRSEMIENHGFDDSKSLNVPTLIFRGFHPDITYAQSGGRNIHPVPTSPYHSAMGLWFWRKGWEADDVARTLTRGAAALPYQNFWRQAVTETQGYFANSHVSFADFFLPLQASGRPFMYTHDHPSIAALAQLARSIARVLGETRHLDVPMEDFLPDALADLTIWPVYPGLAENLSLEPGLFWRFGKDVRDARSYLNAQFAALDSAAAPITSRALDDPAFEARMRQLIS